MMDQMAVRCLKCKVPQCRKYCPVSTPIPDVTRLVEEKKAREAAEIRFVAGDIVTGPKTVVEDVAFAKKVALKIDKYCREN